MVVASERKIGVLLIFPGSFPILFPHYLLALYFQRMSLMARKYGGRGAYLGISRVVLVMF